MESKQQPSLQNNLLIKRLQSNVYSSNVSDRKRRVWHDCRNRTSPVCSDNTTCCPTEHDLNHVVFVPEHSDDLTNPKK